MATSTEFRRAAWRHWRMHLARCAGVLGLGAFVFVVLWFVLELIDPAESAEMRAEYAMAVAIVVGLAAAIMFARSAGPDAPEDPHLICPHCNGSLGYYYVVIVGSSGSCPHCGERVLDD